MFELGCSIEFAPTFAKNSIKNWHETDLELSPRPLGTTDFEEIYIRTMGK